MSTAKHLKSIHESIQPDPAEKRQVQDRIDQLLASLRGIAEPHPAGSWAKGTMLKGRKEADVVAVLSEAPDDRTLDSLFERVRALPGVRAAETSRKAVQIEFDDEVSVDLLPVAKVGRTPDGPSIPRKLRHALSGPAHVKWFERHASGTVLHEVVRLTKHLRNTSDPPVRDALGSFAIEIMVVEMAPSGSLDQAFIQVLELLRDGWLRHRRLPDPVDPNNDLLEGVGTAERKAVAHRAKAALEAIRDKRWFALFPKGSTVPGAAAVAGQTFG